MDTTKVTLAGSERKPVGKRTGDQPGDETVEVSVILKPKARAVAPHAGGASVSREEFAEKHGADTAAIDKVKEFAKENDLTVGEVSAERRTVKLEGTAANMVRAFEVKLDRYENEGHQYRARTGGIKLPADLAPLVEAVLGLDDRPQAKTHFRVRDEGSPHAAAAKAVSYTPRQVAQLYQFPLDVDGTGHAVGILELGGGYKPADL
jgi:kumamolisin